MELVSNNTGLVFFFRRNIDMLVLVAAYFQTACRVENFFFSQTIKTAPILIWYLF